MISYLLESGICLALLLGVYYLLLEGEKMHRFNRYFLLFSLIFSLTIPFLTIDMGPTDQQLFSRIDELQSQAEVQKAPAIQLPTTNYDKVPETAASNEGSTLSYYRLLMIAIYSIYLAGAVVMTGRFIKNLFTIFRNIRNHQILQKENISLVLIDECSIPYSFLSYVFVDRGKYKNGQIDDVIIQHEQTHARQKHTLDILFTEILKIIFWFNPLIYYYKKAIRLNHEYLADDCVVGQTSDCKYYQQLLLQIKSDTATGALASSIHYSSIKKRIVMMTKQSSTQLRKLWKQLAVVPVLAGLVFFVSIQQTTAQDVQQMSLSELMESVNNRIESDDTLSEKEQDALQKLQNTIQKRSEPKPPPPPQRSDLKPPPPPQSQESKAPKNEGTKFGKISTRYSGLIKHYLNLKRVGDNKKEMKSTLDKIDAIYDKWGDKFRESDKTKPLAPPPATVKPKKNDSSNNSAVTADTSKDVTTYLKIYNEDENKIEEYMSMKAVPANQQKLEQFYKKLTESHRKAIKAYHKAKEINKNIKDPHLPRPPKPAKRLGNQYDSEKSLTNISPADKRQLDQLFEKLRVKFTAYRNITPVSANMDQLETAYIEMKDAHSVYMDKRKAVYGNAAINFIPLLAEPDSRVKDNVQKSSDNQQDHTDLELIEGRYVTLTALYYNITPITQNRAKMESVLKKINAIYDRWNDKYKERDKNDPLNKPSGVNARMMVYYRYRPELAQNNKEIQQVAAENYKKGRTQYMDVSATSENKDILQDKYSELSEYYNSWNSIMEQSDYGITMQPLPNSAQKRIKENID